MNIFDDKNFLISYNFVVQNLHKVCLHPLRRSEILVAR